MCRRSLPHPSLSLPLLVALCLAALAAPAVEAQPFDSWYQNNSGTHRYVLIPHHPSLNPSAAFTLEAWVQLFDPPGSCPSIAGKGYTTAWWVGICEGSGGNGVVRSYLAGTGSLRDGGVVPLDTWTHIAVTYDGVLRRHWINGELAAQFAQGGLLPGNSDPLRIGSDEDWFSSPTGAIDEVRLWNVARTQAQLRASLNKRINTAQPGLVAVWPLNASGNDVIGARDGSLVNSPTFFTFAVFANCAGFADANTLCLNNRFAINAFWRTDPSGPVDGQAQVGVFNSGSGIFWFFAASNWEVMIKAINGCGLNNRHWIFSAATTNVFYRVEVFDVNDGEQKIYFNYPGPPAPAVTDTDAFATCP